MLFVRPNLTIPARHLEVRVSRSGGPGGQHVNKTETQVELRFNVGACDLLPEPVKQRLRILAGRRLTKDDILQVVCGKHRERPQNRSACDTRMRNLILEALKPPPPPRKKKRISRGVQRRRLAAKRERSARKSERGRSWGSDD